MRGLCATPTTSTHLVKHQTVSRRGLVYLPSRFVSHGRGDETVCGASYYVDLGGISPERKAAGMMKTLFTMCAVKIVLAQMEGSSAGRGGTAFGTLNPSAVQTLYTHLEEHELRDGDEWIASLMTKDRLLALRLVQVREDYCREGFEWENLEKVAVKTVEEGGINLLRKGLEFE